MILCVGDFVEKIRAFYKTPEGIATEKGSNISENTWPYPIPQAEIDKVGGHLFKMIIINNRILW